MSITKTLILGAAMLWGAVATDAGERVRVRVPVAALRAPADLRIYIMVEPDAANRVLRVSAESPEFFRSSEMPLQGEGGARVTVLYFRELPSGSYDVTAELIGADGKSRGRAHSWLTIL